MTTIVQKMWRDGVTGPDGNVLTIPEREQNYGTSIAITFKEAWQAQQDDIRSLLRWREDRLAFYTLAGFPPKKVGWFRRLLQRVGL